MTAQISAPEIETGLLEASAESTTEGPHPVELGPDALAVLGLPASVMNSEHRPESETMNFEGKLYAGGALAATLGDVDVTATLTYPDDQPFLFISFRFKVFANGFRTGRGGHEASGMPHCLFFKNSAGGTVYSYAFPSQEIQFGCDWNGKERHYVIREEHYTDWFYLWRGIEHKAAGTLYRCP